MKYFVKTPEIIRWLFPGILWKIKTSHKILFLTFDDGPNPDSTQILLNLLKKHGAIASFFVLGEKAKAHPKLFQAIKDGGHTIGFHGKQHLNARKISFDDFLKNIKIDDILSDVSYYRPAFGKFTYRQYIYLKKIFKTVIWSIMPGDFDQKSSAEKIRKRMYKYSGAGEIIVLHDNTSTIDKLKTILPEFIEDYKRKGYSFEALK